MERLAHIRTGRAHLPSPAGSSGAKGGTMTLKQQYHLAAFFFLLSAVAFLVVAYLTTRWLAIISGLMSMNAVLYFIKSRRT